MRRVFLLLLLPVLAPAQPAGFGDFFEPRTLRIDYYHTGNAAVEEITIDRLIVGGPWAGNPQSLIDPLGMGRYAVRVYDVASNRWQALSSANIPFFRSGSEAIDDRVAVSIPTYGVIGVIAFDFSDASAKMYLYKHAPGAVQPPDVTPPSVPASVSVD